MSSPQQIIDNLGEAVESAADVHSPQCFDSLVDITDKYSNLFQKRLKLKQRSLNAPFLERNFDDTEPLFGYDATPEFIKNGTLRDYQLEGVNWLIALYLNGVNGILADEMGLGKTLQTITFLGYLKHVHYVNGPFLIIVPKSTLKNWMDEIERWCPSLKSLCLLGDKSERRLYIRDRIAADQWDICVTSYEMSVREKSKLQKLEWAFIVLDEGHRIKNEYSQLAKVLRNYDSLHCLLLTGTPLQNNLHELWALLNFIMPELFDSSPHFHAWFEEQSKNPIESPMKRLHTVLKPFVLRRFKVDVETGLLPKEEIKVMVGMTALQRELYRSILTKNMELLGPDAPRSRISLENVIMNLRKCTNHPYLFDGIEPGPHHTNDMHLVTNSGKMIIMDKLLLKLKGQGSRVLLFTQMVRMMDILEDYCSFRQFEFCRMDGNTDQETRAAQLQRFNDPNSKVFIFMLSTRAGGMGINLTSADSVVIFDSDWNPHIDLQAIDRAHRIGQTKKVRVFRFVTEHTIEEKIVQRADFKQTLDSRLMAEIGFIQPNRRIRSSSMLNVLRFGADSILNNECDDNIDHDLESVLQRSSSRMSAVQMQAAEQHVEDLVLPALPSTVSLYDFEDTNYRTMKLAKVRQPASPLAPRHSPLRPAWSNFGFDWTKQDFDQFIEAVAKYGTTDVESVVQSFGDKPAKEVRAFQKEFWVRWRCLANYEELKQRFKRSDRKIERLRKFDTFRKGRQESVAMQADVMHALNATPSYIRNGELYAFQLQGAVWIVSNLSCGRNVWLGDQGGLGKTVQAITVMGYYSVAKRETNPHLLIVPSHLIGMWQQELFKWCPTLLVRTVLNETDHLERICKHRSDEFDWYVCLTTYDMFAQRPSMFIAVAWTLVVVDEAQRLARADDALCSTLNDLDNNHRLLLSGAPYLSSVAQFRGIYSALFPEVWSSGAEFLKWSQEHHKSVQDLHVHAMPLLKALVLRRKILRIYDARMPAAPQAEQLVGVTLKPSQIQIYSLLMAKLRQTKGNDEGAKKALFLSVMQCVQHPYLLRKDAKSNVTIDGLLSCCGKLSKLDEMLATLKSEGARVLLCTQSSHMLFILEWYLHLRQYKFCVAKSDNAYEMTRQFNEPNGGQFIFAMASDRDYMNGLGVPTVDTVVFYDYNWNTAQNALALTRAYRLGRAGQIRVYRLVTVDTIEDCFIYHVVKAKNRGRNYELQVSDINFILDEFVDRVRCEAIGKKRADSTAIECAAKRPK